MIRKCFLWLAVSAISFHAVAQKSYNEQVQDYIARFKDLAVAEQLRSGIPASITLAQGIFETGAGSSELCNNAANHFGIKCKNTWEGETYTYTDDAKDECFRKYTSADHSYRDHSDFLKNNKRYSSLFALSPTDYAAWAHGLKRCGYATNPAYAKKLIKTIEDYNLQEYTYAALGDNTENILLASAGKKAAPRSQTVATVMPGEHIPVNDGFVSAGKASAPVVSTDEAEEMEILQAAAARQDQGESGVKDYYQTTTRNGKKGFYARKGDMLLEYAIRNRIRYAKLLEMNDLPDTQLEADMFVYLERKSKTGQAESHKVAAGESLLQISQSEGIQLQQLRAFNQLDKGEEPAPGTVLSLQHNADRKPSLAGPGNSQPAIGQGRTPRLSNDDGFVPAGRKTAAARKEVEEEVATDAGTQTEPVNIANETPVEETIAAERRQAPRQQAPAPQKEERNMTALEKLKAHMDKTVYADGQEFQPQASGNYEDEGSTYAPGEISTTTPARRNSPNVTKNTVKQEERRKESPKAKAKAKVHTVRKGETLFAIAQKYDLSVGELQKLNKLSGKSKIQPGMKLQVAR